MVLLDVLIGLVAGGAAFAGLGFLCGMRVVKQYERGVVFRWGRVLEQTRGPGLTVVVPGVDRLRRVNLQIVTMSVPAVITVPPV